MFGIKIAALVRGLQAPFERASSLGGALDKRMGRFRWRGDDLPEPADSQHWIGVEPGPPTGLA